jgi:hypothetical protein
VCPGKVLPLKGGKAALRDGLKCLLIHGVPSRLS